MISVDAALELIRQHSRALPAETVPLAQAEGRVLAEAVHAARALPPFHNSAMDGYALHWRPDIEAGRVLPVLGEQAAGDGERTLGEGAFAIMTGALMPKGADTVVPVEDVTVLARDAQGRPLAIRLDATPVHGQHVRLSGQDVALGSAVLAAGIRLSPEALMILRGVGIARVVVHRRPRVALACTGRELVDEDGAALLPGQIANTNGPYLAWLLQRCGAELVAQVTVPDDADALEAQVHGWEAMGIEVVVTTGAVSMGRYDFVPDVLKRVGAEVVFHKLAMRPGKPLLFARLRSGALFFGLPGNPVSSAVGARFFVSAALRRLCGQGDETPWPLPLAAATSKKAGFRMIQKAELQLGERGQLQVLPSRGQESFRIAPMLRAQAWLHLPEAAEVIAAGSLVAVYPADPQLDTLFYGA